MSEVETNAPRPAASATRRSLYAFAGFAVCFAFYASYARYGNLIEDEGWLLDSAQRVWVGQAPFADFPSIYTPGRFYLFALVLWVFDDSFMAMRLTWAAMRAAVVVLVFAVGVRVMPRRYALGATLLTLIMPGPWVKTLYPLVPLCVLPVVAAWSTTRNRRLLAVAGALGGIGVWFRQDTGLFILFAVSSLLVLDGLARRDSRDALRNLAALLVPPAIVTVLVLLWFAPSISPIGIAKETLFRSVSEGGTNQYLMRELMAFRIEGVGPVSGRIIAALCLLPFVIALPRAVWAGARLLGGDSSTRVMLWWCIAVIGFFAGQQVLRRDPLIRFTQIGPIIYLLVFGAAATFDKLLIRRDHREWAGLFRGLAIVVPIVFIWFAHQPTSRTRTTEYLGSAIVRFLRAEPLDVRGETIYMTETRAGQLRHLVRLVWKNSEPGEPILVLGRPSALYYLTDRPNPSGVVRLDEQVEDPRVVGMVRDLILSGEIRFIFTYPEYLERTDGHWRGFLNQNATMIRGGDWFRMYEADAWAR